MHTFRVVSDLICPWCYIGKGRLEAALRELPSGTEASVSWHPFQLNPEMPPHGMDRKEYCMCKFGSWDRCQQMYAQISEVGMSVGLVFRFDLQPTIPNTFVAHRIIWLADQFGVQDSMVEALFRGFFCEGLDLSDKAEETLPVEGAFIFIGLTPNTGFLDGSGIRLNRWGFVVTGRELIHEGKRPVAYEGRDPHLLETSIPGIFAAGDVRDGSTKQVASAAAEGASAALMIREYLKGI